MRVSTRRLLAVPIAAVSLALSGCGGDSGDSGESAATTAAEAGAPGSSAESTAAATATESPTEGATVDANNASVDELTAAFEAAGIASADRWAREVAEYRPYPTDDPTFAKLRQELAKYNPSDAVVEQIVATLSL